MTKTKARKVTVTVTPIDMMKPFVSKKQVDGQITGVFYGSNSHNGGSENIYFATDRHILACYNHEQYPANNLNWINTAGLGTNVCENAMQLLNTTSKGTTHSADIRADDLLELAEIALVMDRQNKSKTHSPVMIFNSDHITVSKEGHKRYYPDGGIPETIALTAVNPEYIKKICKLFQQSGNEYITISRRITIDKPHHDTPIIFEALHVCAMLMPIKWSVVKGY